MKTTFIFSVIFSCFFLFSSCSSDDDSSQIEQANLQGKWLLEGTTFDGEFQEWPPEVGDVFFDFRTEGVLIVIDDDGSESGTYQVSGNNLTIRIDNVSQTYEITKLTNNKLDLFGREEVDEEDGLDEITYHLSKN